MKEKIMHGSFQTNKSQVTLTYNDINKPKNIEKIVLSLNMMRMLILKYVRKKIEEIIRDEIKEDT